MPDTLPPHIKGSSDWQGLDLNQRSREILKQIVESYLSSGEPVGSRNLSRILHASLSPASIRNVMSDLEHAGLIFSPHTSAGRLPTERGLRFFVDAMMETGDVALDDRKRIESEIRAHDSSRSFETMLTEASQLLSGLTRSAGVVVTQKANAGFRQIEFVKLDHNRALVVLVSEDGTVENRIIEVPQGLPASAMTQAGNYLSERLRGRTLKEIQAEIEQAQKNAESELDAITAKLVSAGLAVWGGADDTRQLIIRGQAHLLDDLTATEDLERVRLLFADIETKKELIDLIGRAETGDGVRIYIGSENKLFSLSGSSVIAAPFRDSAQKIIGVLGVIGPTRLNYARIVPMVDFTAKIISSMLTKSGR